MTAPTTYNQYAIDVLSGELPACEPVIQACQRYVADLETGDERGIWFDAERADHAIQFFGFLRHSKGQWAGQRFELAPWQQFIVAQIFGWLRDDPEGGPDPVRRFRTAYIEVPRKNGKSTLAAGMGLYLLDADGEPGAEIYSAATKRDQARITHKEAERMVKASPGLSARLRTYRDNIHSTETASKYEPLGRDSDSMDGLNVHGAIVDELHAHKNRDTWDMLETATGARRQPLLLAITTAGRDWLSLCRQLHDFTLKLLGGVLDDDSHFGIVFTLDEGDDHTDPAAWIKANPNLGISKKIDDLKRMLERVQAMPAGLSSFLRLHFNVWSSGAASWIDMDKWNACDLGGLTVGPDRRRVCYGGLDLANTIDIAAWIKVFSPSSPGQPFEVDCRFYVPEVNIDHRVRLDRVPYDQWAREGFITATPGDYIDHDVILADIQADAASYDLREMAFDRWGAVQVYTRLAEMGIEAVQFGQGFASMSSPMKELERLILHQLINHGGNPVLRWMASNVVASEDAAGNIKPDKARSREKIDGVVALIMALDRALRHEPEHQGGPGWVVSL